MNIDCLASGLDRTIFAGVKRGMADSMGAYCGDQGRVSSSKGAVTSAPYLYDWRCYCSFSYSIAFSSKLFLSEPMIFTYCASNPPLQPATGKRSERQWYVKLGNTIPKPHHWCTNAYGFWAPGFPDFFPFQLELLSVTLCTLSLSDSQRKEWLLL